MEEDPFFSIIMPTFNRASFLKRSIQSVLEQTYSSWELLIIDDGSADDTVDVVRLFDDERIRYHYQPNQGKSVARNVGIDKSTGRYIAFLDSDDEFKANHLEIHKMKIDKENYPVALFYTLGHYCSRQGNLTAESHPLCNDELSFQVAPMTLSITVHRAILEKNKFEPSLSIREDSELWDRIRRQNYSFVRIDEYTVVAYYHKNNSRKDLFDYYCNLEYAIKFYVKSRLVFSREEYHKLLEAYEKLTYLNFMRNNYKTSIIYLLKEIGMNPLFVFKRPFWGMIKRYGEKLLKMQA